MERLLFDNVVLAGKGEVGSKTMSVEKLQDYVKGFSPRTWPKKGKFIGGK